MSVEDELRQVEEDLTRLRAQTKDLRDQIGDMGATDQVEVGAMIGMADEQEELIADLERRRDDLLRRRDGG
ncbi:hypothetical protein AB0F17_47955 [Nonomuraea sp. NPDC026600]|uniref:hypothetical protein n=1 Tax=Nonomuraea sp. NPDC026600 TaxID=3155363 RepID=UPI0033E27374